MLCANIFEHETYTVASGSAISKITITETFGAYMELSQCNELESIMNANIWVERLIFPA